MFAPEKVACGHLTYKNSYVLAFPGPGNPSNRCRLRFPASPFKRELLGRSGARVMTSFLFTYVFGHFRPWEAVCEQLHASAVLTVKVSASGTVWSPSCDLSKVSNYRLKACPVPFCIFVSRAISLCVVARLSLLSTHTHCVHSSRAYKLATGNAAALPFGRQTRTGYKPVTAAPPSRGSC